MQEKGREICEVLEKKSRTGKHKYSPKKGNKKTACTVRIIKVRTQYA